MPTKMMYVCIPGTVSAPEGTDFEVSSPQFNDSECVPERLDSIQDKGIF